MKAGIGFDAESRVGGIKAPTLVLSGDADAIVPAQNSRNLAQQIPGARLRLVRAAVICFSSSSPMNLIEIWLSSQRKTRMTYARIIGTGSYVPEKV